MICSHSQNLSQQGQLCFMEEVRREENYILLWPYLMMYTKIVSHKSWSCFWNPQYPNRLSHLE